MNHVWVGLLFISSLLSATLAAASNSGVTYQGRILKPDGSPLSGQYTQFKLQIRTPDAQDCLMYEEIQSQDLRNSSGVFSLTINDGTGSRTDTTGLTLDRIFANRGTFTLNVSNCASGGGTYMPNASDGRNLVVSFKDETMMSWEPIPAQKINFVPFAFETKQVQGFGADSLLRVVGAGGDPLTGVSPLSNAQYTELLALLDGTSSQFTKSGQLNGVALPTMSAGEVLGWNGSAWVSTVASGGPNSVTSAMIQNAAVDSSKIAAGAVGSSQIASGAVGTSQIASNVSISTTGTLGSAITTTRDFKIYAASPSAYYVGMLADPGLAASYTLTWPLTAGSANQVLTTDGSGKLTWTSPSSAGITDLTGDVTATGPGSAAATVASVGGSTAAQVHSAELAANAATSLNTPNTLVKRDGSGDFAAGGISATSVTATGVVSAGNVGIGTTSPDVRLTISQNASPPITANTGSNLHIVGADNSSNAFTMDAFGTNKYSTNYITLRRAQNTAAAPGYPAPLDWLGSIQFQGWNGSSFGAGGGAAITAWASEAWTPSASGAGFYFTVTPKGSNSAISPLVLSGEGALFGATRSIVNWNTTGASIAVATQTLTDLTGSGTIAGKANVSVAQPTYASSSSQTVTNASNVYIAGPPIAGTNMSFTNSQALYVATGNSIFGGNVGIGTTAPSAKLEVVGSLRVGDGGETCGASLTGAIRYNGGNLQFCAGSMPWTTLGVSGAGLTALTGDVTAAGSGSVAATVASVGGSTAALVHSAELAANAATSANTASTIVKRDASGNFSAGAISVTSVTATGAVTQGSAVFKDSGSNTVTVQAPTSVSSSYVLKWPTAAGGSGDVLTTDASGNLSWTTPSGAPTGSAGGDLSGSYPNPSVATVGASTAANVHSAELLANAATAANTSNAIVKRDGSGNFSASDITVASVKADVLHLNNAGSIVDLVNPIGAAYTLTLPTGTGTNGQVLQTDGSGNLSWAAAGGGSLWTQHGSNISYDGVGKVGIGTTAPSSNLSFGSAAAQTIGVERSTGGAAGNNLTISAGSATSGGSNLAGGDLILSAGTSTGNGAANIKFQTGWGYSGSSDNAPTTVFTINNAGGWAANSNSNGSSGIFKFSNQSSGSSAAGHIMVANNTGTATISMGVNSTTNTSAINGGLGSMAFLGTSATNGLSISSGGSPSTSNNMFFSTSGSERMRIASSGEVGIGTTSPVGALEIASTSAGVYNPNSNFPNSGTVVRHTNTYSGATSVNSIVFDNNYSGAHAYAYFAAVRDGGWSDLVFGSRNGASSYVETLRLASSGNVGIGTTAPGAPLHVASSVDTDIRVQSAAGNTPTYLSNSAGGSAILGLNVSANGTVTSSASPQWRVKVSGSDFYSIERSPAGASYTPSSLFYISNAGNVGIGTTSPSQTLEVNGTIKATDIILTSDRNAKHDIRSLDGQESLRKVSDLRPVAFRWNSTGRDDLGVIAQEVESVYPDLVYHNPDGSLSVKYNALISPMISSIQELNRKNAELETRNRDLEARLMKLEERMDLLARGAAK